MATPNFDDFRELGKFQLDALNAATNSTARGLRAIAAEATEYSKQSLDKGRVYFEKLLRVQKIDDIVELQSQLYRDAYGDFFARAARVGELCSDLARETIASAQTAGEQATKAATEATSKIIAGVGEQTRPFAPNAREGAKTE